MTGASAAAQARSLQAAGQAAQAGISRDLFLAQEAAKQKGLDALESTAQFDVGQKGREAELFTTLGLGLESLEVQREAGALSAQASRDAAKAAADQPGFFESALNAINPFNW